MWDQVAAHYHAMPRKPGSRTHPLLIIPPAEFAGHVYAWVIERIQHDKLDEWHEDLRDLLPWQTSESESAEEIESASFYANYNAQ